MSQNDFNIANQGFPATRADINSALQALASTSAGATAPSTTYAYQMWYDETADLLKMRNSDNDAWITLAAFDQTADEWELRSAVIQAVDSAGVVIKTDDGTTRVTVADNGNVTLANDLVVTGTVQASNISATGSMASRNKIINGAMVIDQRNAGASVTPASGNYTLDRWQYAASQASKFTVEQTVSGISGPAGFVNYAGLTTASTASVSSGDYFIFRQMIEGNNVADLGWGSADAQPVTLSFWVRSSLTGTFGGALNNSALDRSYPFTFAISASNTWEYKTVTIAGDTSGTWLTTNGIGVHLHFGLGVGSTNSGAAGSWSGSALFSATGATSVVGTSGATFYITGVQLEAGDTATPFEHRSYGQELALCERYFEVGSAEISQAAGPNGFTQFVMPYRQTKRVAPTATFTNGFGLGGGSSAQAICPFKLSSQSTITAWTASAEL